MPYSAALVPPWAALSRDLAHSESGARERTTHALSCASQSFLPESSSSDEDEDEDEDEE